MYFLLQAHIAILLHQNKKHLSNNKYYMFCLICIFLLLLKLITTEEKLAIKNWG